MAKFRRQEWAGRDSKVARYVRDQRIAAVKAYLADPTLIRQFANQEQDAARGGYADRQIYELSQNSADAISKDNGRGKFFIHLTADSLYCADDGAPLTTAGAESLLYSNLSPKRSSAEIGRFGLGFKSVLRVSNAPEFFSRSGSIRWGGESAERDLSKIQPGLDYYPVLRVAEAFDPKDEIRSDPILDSLASWATNIVRLPLLDGAVERLRDQLRDFPKEFLLFVPHVSEVELIDQSDPSGKKNWQGTFSCSADDGVVTLESDGKSEGWFLTSMDHELSTEAKDDARELDISDTVTITWAAPLSGPAEPGRFWAFFPTRTESLVSGIVNSHWKTNEDRQNLLEGDYNDELIRAAARLIADALPKLSTPVDPARHLDMLPRRSESWDGSHGALMRDALYFITSGMAIAPDQSGDLRAIGDIGYPPEEFFNRNGVNLAQDAFASWAQYPQRPTNWLHHASLARNDFSRLQMVYEASFSDPGKDGDYPHIIRGIDLPHATIADWLEALVERARMESAAGITISAIDASKAAIQTAALIPEDLREGEDLGQIILTRNNRWVSPDPNKVFLGGEAATDAEYIVHKDLENDDETRDALETLGIKSADQSELFRQKARQILDGRRHTEEEWHDFWVRGEEVTAEETSVIIREVPRWLDRLHIKTMDGEWRTLHQALLPGAVVPGDGSRDAHATIDVHGYHAGHDEEVLRALGAVDEPTLGFRMPAEQMMEVRRRNARVFIQTTFGRRPKEDKVRFRQEAGEAVGPLPVLAELSDEGKCRYTEIVLEDAPATLANWVIYHDVFNPARADMHVKPPIVDLLLEHGRIETLEGTKPLRDGLGDPPRDALVRDYLVSHANSDDISKAFDIPVVTATDLIRYVRENASDDAERLLLSVGSASALQEKLSEDLIEILEEDKGQPLTDREIAQAAINTFHTGALQEYRDSLTRLNPPSRWAGSKTAIEFVVSLGFSEGWAGTPRNRPESYEVVDGPLTLPKLHDYQRSAAKNIKAILTMPAGTPARRGMLSMPTGSGKTRVAVQAIVEAMRDDNVSSGVLWVADSEELCEQAVESWREVWASEGVRATTLRISRVWGGQEEPPPVSEFHIVVASRQTLSSRLRDGIEGYQFLKNFDIVVFDEAHRSIAPTATSVMEELGLTRYQRDNEPILLGLTATPYRGYDVEETRRLVNRYSSRRLETGAFKSNEPEKIVQQLQKLGSLALADHEKIQGGNLTLTPDQLEYVKTFSRLPDTAEQSIGADRDRTRRILEAIDKHIDKNWQTLIFAASVEHAGILSALLNARGISARPVSGETRPSDRRSIVEAFRNREIRVLVNYSVFREGFDAPATRAIVVARPVYSPNLYFQMIGRGLRGIKNGGNNRCLILNVEDNIENYAGRLAFSDLDWLWA